MIMGSYRKSLGLDSVRILYFYLYLAVR